MTAISQRGPRITPDLSDALAIRNYIRDLIEELVPGIVLPEQKSAKIVMAGTQAIPNAAATEVDFDTYSFDRWTNAIDLANNQIVVREEGIYLLIVGMNWSGNATGYRQFEVIHNGGSTTTRRFEPVGAAASGEAIFDGLDSKELHIGDTLRINVTQTSGAALNLNDLRFTLARWGP